MKIWSGRVIKRDTLRIIDVTIWDLTYFIVVTHGDDIYLLDEVILPYRCEWILNKHRDKIEGMFP